MLFWVLLASGQINIVGSMAGRRAKLRPTMTPPKNCLNVQFPEGIDLFEWDHLEREA